MKIAFIVYSRGAPQGSKKAFSLNQIVESSVRVKPFRQDVRFTALEFPLPDGWPMDAPMRVSYEFNFKRPKSHYTRLGQLVKSAVQHPTGKNIGDIEKLARAVSDALTGVVFEDDKQVVEMNLTKSFAETDLVIINVEPLVYNANASSGK